MAEKWQIMRECDWNDCAEVGKFYPPIGHNWYYYMYGDPTNRAGQRNHVVARCAAACSPQIRQNLRGDVIIVRSGPLNIKHDPYFTLSEVADAVMLYCGRNGRDPSQVLAEREAARCGYGFPGGPTPISIHGDSLEAVLAQLAMAKKGGGFGASGGSSGAGGSRGRRKGLEEETGL